MKMSKEDTLSEHRKEEKGTVRIVCFTLLPSGKTAWNATKSNIWLCTSISSVESRNRKEKLNKNSDNYTTHRNNNFYIHRY